MAQKRMFDKKVVCSDKFIDLPNSSKALYFMAGIEADDKGFFQPRSLQRLCGFSDDDFKILIAKGFFITFESGVMVVTDWNKNNWLDSRRVTETEYVDELRLLKLVNQKYEFDLENASAKPSLSQNRIEENSIEENSIEESVSPTPIKNVKHKFGEYKNVLLSDDDIAKLKDEIPNYQEYIEKVSEYCASTGKTYKNYLATIRNWHRKDNLKTTIDVLPKYDTSKNISLTNAEEQEILNLLKE